ncbi:CRISPR-associated helicase Cas3' [Nitrospirillum sp. BR 11828]|uniref:CRISPR-associated helicase Cas3' n=1 Tax=Nitrospirillum sp. BR 11828 TaxID=3104325 RepID=UPI002ACA4E00|nr:CRISPR-associated helicase Cas3' [Nitrospirillum sp. BR 11828]MDZ5649992.1 CRISPR-associated helicase Cas3' [Nitrospirillum sp. BR 11828]
MLPPYLSAYWGKAQPRPDAAHAWHPLAYHSLDVAAVMGALLEVRPAWLTAMAARLGLPTPTCRQRLILAAAFHDLGKFAENFQGKVPALHQQLLGAIGRPPIPRLATDGHGDVGHSLWRTLAKPRGLRGLTPWVEAAVAHHGAPTAKPPLNNAMTQASIADAGAYVDAVLGLLGTPDFPGEQAEELGAEIWRAAGLVILADWIGSNQSWFPYTALTLPLDIYWARAQAQAARAVAEADLAEAPLAGRLLLADLLPQAEATPLQARAEDEPPPSAPCLYIVEDLTGAGKTEAALILAHRLMAAGQAEGLYWALPTMATANGLYGRLAATYRRLFGDGAAGAPSLVLAHSARDLNTAFQLSIPRDGHAAYGPDTRSPGTRSGAEQARGGEAQCAAFIADDRKKTFLAQVGVGTLDQALLAVLPVRHQALRLAALSRRVLVVDEAHAYDPYMTRTLEALLRFQGRLGGSAVVLSATLTGAQRQALAGAFAGRAVSLTRHDFPLLTRVSAGAVTETPVASGRGTRRDLPVRRLDRPEDAMAALLDAAGQGRCGVYIRNTVRDALAAVDHLRRHAPAGVTVDLFHARYCLGDRLAREGAVLDRFGKASTPEGRRGHVLVATQVVEQSLDLDFDHMATDLAPMDLLIQRAGRLHRHSRPGRPPPELWVVGPPANAEADAAWYQRHFPFAAKVYDDPAQLWLTQRTLDGAIGDGAGEARASGERTSGLPLASRSPRDLIEPVFGAHTQDLPPALVPQGEAAAGRRAAARGVARLNTLDPDLFDRGAAAWDSDIETPTRLGDPTLTLRLARWHDGVLTPWWREAPGAGGHEGGHRTWRLSELTVRAGLVAQAMAPDVQAQAAIGAQRAQWPEDAPPSWR